MATFLILCVFTAAISTSVSWVEADKGEQRTLHRQKREWIIPPKKLEENVDYTNLDFIAKIRSDEETRTDIEYFLEGEAATAGLFSVGRKNGFVRIHGILDRERAASYDLKGQAKLRDGRPAEKDLELKIIVLDQNDCPPVFNIQMTGSVDELSEEGTLVMIITATDADEENSPHSQIAYNVAYQEPDGMRMFKIERSSGEVRVRVNTLDRETQDTYKLVITGTDMNGGTVKDNKNGPMTGTGTITIKILDVNDNVPILEKNYYEGSVEENTIYVEAIRIKALDKDLIHTENWEAVYTIISGNEAGYFNITTDTKTNEGIIMVTKELDYEALKEVNLQVVVSNKASYHKSVVIDTPKAYPIKIKVVNVPEAPHFQPAVKVISISEDRTTIDLKKVIATYTATDSDTLLPATNVRYIKIQDINNWVSINEKTAEIRLNKYPDRESKFLVNGTYYTKIICITSDLVSKTATGTLAIQVQDFNDHCPLLTHSVETICYGSSVVYVTATDGDKYPNAEPFEFRLVAKGTKETWSVERLNETTVILRSQEELWPGSYAVELEVLDQQGKFCQGQKLQVSVCKCTEEQVCQPQRRSSIPPVLGAGGVLALLLGILLLLFIPMLLLLCECGGAAAMAKFQPFPFDINQGLLTYHTEGQGEDKELAVLSKPSVHDSIRNPGYGGGYGEGFGEGHGARYGEGYREGSWKNVWSLEEIRRMLEKRNAGTIIGGHSELIASKTIDSMALSDKYLYSYFAEKSLETAKQEASVNHLLVSNYETCNSVTGSLEDICSHLHEENNLDFLNDLGPQFRRLAEISYGSAIEIEGSQIPTSSSSSSSKVAINVSDSRDAVHGFQNEVTSSSSSTTTNITATGGAIGQTLLIQQPVVYLPSTPMYVVEQQQPTLLLASGPMLGESNVVLVEKGATNIAISPHSTLPRLGLQQASTRVVMDQGIGGTVVHGKSVQESNMVLLENEATNIAISPQSTLPRLGLNQANTRVLLDQGIGGTVIHGISGHSEPQGTVSGSVHVVETRRVESTEPVHVVQSSSHSRISKNTQAKGQNGGVMTLESAPVIQSPISLLQQKPLFAASNGSTHQEVREERVSVVERSFQSSSTS